MLNRTCSEKKKQASTISTSHWQIAEKSKQTKAQVCIAVHSTQSKTTPPGFK